MNTTTTTAAAVKLNEFTQFAAAAADQAAKQIAEGRTPSDLFPYRNWHEVETANKQAGLHFFDADTMRFFSTNLLGNVNPGGTFALSDKAPWGRVYRVAYMDPFGGIERMTDADGEHIYFSSAANARKAAEKLSVALVANRTLNRLADEYADRRDNR